MKVLVCSNFYYPRGGDCTYLRTLREILEGEGHEVGVFSTEHEGNWAPPAHSAFVPAPDYAVLNRKKTLQGAWMAARRSIWSGEVAKALRRFLAEWRPDVAHLQNIHAYLTPSILPELKRACVPVVQTLHDYKWLCPDSSMLRPDGRVCDACAGRAFRHCVAGRCKKGSFAASAMAAAEGYVHSWKHAAQMVDAWIAPSEFVRRTFVLHGWDGGKIHALLNPCPRGGLQKMPVRDGGYGLYVGSLAPHKGVDVLLKALKYVPGHRLHVVGGGSDADRARLASLAETSGVSARVDFLGQLHGEALWREQAGARYGVIPSIWYEVLGYTAMEMLSIGKPVVGSDIGAIPELVRDDQTGLLFPAGDAAALAGCMRRLAADPALAGRLGAAGRELVERECAHGKYYRGVMDVYRSALGTEGMPQPGRGTAEV